MGINFNNVKTNEPQADKTFEIVPVGLYAVIVEDAKIAMSKANNEKLSLTFKILEGQYKNRKLWTDLSALPNALVFIKYFMEAIGSKYANSENAELVDIANDAKNKVCKVWVETSPTPSGGVKNEIKRFEAVSGATIAPATAPSTTTTAAPSTPSEGTKKPRFA